MKENNDMSEDNDSKLNLDKDDEDDSDSLSNPYKKSHSKDKISSSPPGAPRISPRKPSKFSEYLGLLGKHDRSFESSNSSDSMEIVKKKKQKELTSFQLTIIKSQKENFDNNYNILKEDFKLLEEYETKIFKDTNLDIMFIMDLTGSMSIWLNEAKKSIKNIIEEITDNNPGSKIRISFIGYRDFLEKDEKREYDTQEFTENIDEFNQFISKLDCNGGGDEPEDIVGALRQALKMNWLSNAKYAILVSDAPCHGKQYHNISYDRFADGDPEGVPLEDVIKQFVEKDITFYCIEINSTTKKMFDIMKSIYNNDNKFHVEKLGNSVHQFSFFVAFSASVLLGNAKYNKIKFADVLANCRNETIEKIMKKYINNNNIIMNKNSDVITSQLISELENLNIGDEDKKLFDFINRMNDLNISKDSNSNNNILNTNINNINNNTEKKTNQILSDSIPDIKNITQKDMEKFYKEAGNYLPKSNGALSQEQINLLMHQSKIMQRNVDALQETNRSLQDFIIYTMKKDSMKKDMNNNIDVISKENNHKYEKLNKILIPLYNQIDNLQSKVKELNEKKRENEINVELDDLIIKNQSNNYKSKNIPKNLSNNKNFVED